MDITKSFWQVAESWYQRTQRLREYSEDNEKAEYKRKQAWRLFCKMFYRMQNITQVAIRINTPIKPIKFPSGGIIDEVSKDGAGSEWVAPKTDRNSNGMEFREAWIDEAIKIPFKD